MDIFRREGDSEDAKTLYTEPKVDPFDAPRFQQIWIFFAARVIVKMPKHCTLCQKLTLLMPQYTMFWHVEFHSLGKKQAACCAELFFVSLESAFTQISL